MEHCLAHVLIAKASGSREGWWQAGCSMSGIIGIEGAEPVCGAEPVARGLQNRFEISFMKQLKKERHGVQGM